MKTELRLTRVCEREGADCPISDERIRTKLDVSPKQQSVQYCHNP